MASAFRLAHPAGVLTNSWKFMLSSLSPNNAAAKENAYWGEDSNRPFFTAVTHDAA